MVKLINWPNLKKEFLDANSSLLASNDSRSYDEVFNSWRVLLKDPTSVKKFKNIQNIRKEVGRNTSYLII